MSSHNWLSREIGLELVLHFVAQNYSYSYTFKFLQQKDTCVALYLGV